MSRVIAIMACGLSLAACTSSLSSWNFLKSAPQTETLRIESEPPGAEAKASGGQNCRTPCELAVQSDTEFSVTLALNGYQSQTISVRPEMPAGNARESDGSGSGPKLAPNPVYVELQPATVTPAKKPAVKKKKPVAAAKPAAPPPTTTASVPTAAPSSPPPPPAAAPATDSAASATNYPWPTR
jgi:PEGA domain